MQSGADGSYAFPQVPAGAHVVSFSQGSFSRTFSVGVIDGVEEDLTLQGSKFCIEADTVKIAVVGGLYDHVEGVLDALQLSYDMKGDDGGTSPAFGPDPASLVQAKTFLRDPQAMAAYDIIFINCGWCKFYTLIIIVVNVIIPIPIATRNKRPGNDTKL